MCDSVHVIRDADVIRISDTQDLSLDSLLFLWSLWRRVLAEAKGLGLLQQSYRDAWKKIARFKNVIRTMVREVPPHPWSTPFDCLNR